MQISITKRNKTNDNGFVENSCKKVHFKHSKKCCGNDKRARNLVRALKRNQESEQSI